MLTILDLGGNSGYNDANDNTNVTIVVTTIMLMIILLTSNGDDEGDNWPQVKQRPNQNTKLEH